MGQAGFDTVGSAHSVQRRGVTLPTRRSRTVAAREPLRAAELAWVLEQVGSIGIRCRSEGWCIGELLPGELRIDSSGLTRVRLQGRLHRLDREFRAGRHQQRGHDPSCRALGVPRSVVERLIDDWGEAGSAGLLLEGIDQAVLELNPGGAQHTWTVTLAMEELGMAIRSRITPARPRSTPNTGFRAKAAAPRWVYAAFEMTYWWISTRGLPRIVQPQVESSSE